MASLLDIAKLQALAATSAYGGQRLLSSMSEALALSIIPMLEDWRIWDDNPHLMTDTEKSVIRDVVDALSAEIMEGSIMANASYHLLYSVSYDYNRATVPINFGDVSAYDEIEVHVYGLITDRLSSADPVKVRVNGDTVQSNYQSVNMIFAASGTTRMSEYKTLAGIRVQRGAGGIDGANGYPSSWKMTITNPSSNKVKQFFSYAATFGASDSDVGMATMAGQWENSDPITSLEIIPMFGTEFLVSTSPSMHYPNEIKAAVYGIG